ncbi:hypothetical protein ALC56_07111 [Trachymyrmex septentrionalis]|uniref:Uncharacterized protein n=1 Tax=Trachymyrmex septentrionalis TaxID=34720 RepID=A0A151JW66_9HYME|nr:hypothetical protein ALC56_07111 [Trachymyrmex septentrionalis]
MYKKTLLPSAERWFIDKNEDWILQEDNDPKHRSKLCTVETAIWHSYTGLAVAVSRRKSKMCGHTLSTSFTHNLVNKMLTQLKTLLKRWKQLGFVENFVYNKLNASNPVAHLAYGLPKIHKVGYPLRIIVSSVRSPLYNLASFLNDILHDSIPVANSFIKNNFHLTKHISNLAISQQSSFHLIERKTNIPKREFFKVLELICNSTIFCFNDKFYKQTFGVPMDSSLSPIVDASHIDTLVNTFNSFHFRLKFTTEISGDKLDFLDISLIKKGNSFIQNWYHEPTFSNRYLNYFSIHPLCQKVRTIDLIDRVLSLSHSINNDLVNTKPCPFKDCTWSIPELKGFFLDSKFGPTIAPPVGNRRHSVFTRR